MRFQTGHAEVLAEGFGETASMKIEASGKAFKGLIDGIYSRKIEAAIRELATNAFDAHKMVGSIAPFDIHLPTPLKPTFWVRDYGPGMDHAFMMERYTTMFDSTKDGLKEQDASLITPDEQVGCLGLGRMSFFAYTDSCTVTIWQGGEARFYSVYIAAKGVPDVSHAGSMPSDEPDGVKVEFAAKPRDFKAFEIAATRVFKGFPVMPNGLPIDVREAIATEPLEMGSFWKAYPKDYLPGGGFYAKQGCVLYPIDLAEIDDRMVVTDSYGVDGEATVELSEGFARFAALDLSVVMDFPIGAIDFDLSRERLAYNERTVAALKARWDDFTSDLDTVIAKSFGGLRTPHERYLTARSPLFTSMGPLFQQTMFFIEASKTEEFIHDLLPFRRNSFNKADHAFKKVVEFRDEDDKQGGNGLRDAIFTYNQRMTYNAPKAEDLHNAVFVYVDDAGRSLNQRVHYHLRQIGKRYAYVFEKGCLTARRWNQMGRPEIIRTSELLALPKEVQERLARNGERGGGVFDRVKIIENDALRAPKEGEDTEDHLFAFINKGVLIKPERDPSPALHEYPDMTIADVMAIHYLLEGTGGPPISFINTRTNDKPGRWDHLPVFYDVLDTLAERLTKKQVGQFIAWLNDRRFISSKYHQALTTITGHGRNKAKLPRNPLTALKRFYLSDGQTDPELSPRYHHLIESKNPALEKITNDIIDIATRMGMDVLPPCDASDKCFPNTLLPKAWEEVVTNINNSGKYSSYHNSAMRVFYGLLMQNAST